MKALIQAGGLGTRLHPITYEIPKPLLPVKKKPIVNHLIEFFDRYGVGEIAVLASRLHDEDFDRWKKAWADSLPFGKVSIFFEDAPRGTFGGLEFLRSWLGNEPFFMTNADDLKSFDLQEILRFHKAQNVHATISLIEVPDPSRYGVPIMDGHKIHTFLEKPENPPSNFINAGLYVLEPEVFSYADFSQDQVSIERDVFPKLAAEGKLAGFKIVDGKWFDCGTLEGWERAMKEW
jgi:NDP-sugar pyrophosphorylase family protein